MRHAWILGLAAVLLGPGCKKDGEGDGTPPPEAPLGVGESGLRRLSHAEVDQVLYDVLLDDTAPASRYLPADVIDPFDNDFTTQEVSAVLVTGFEALATDVATRLVADPARLDALLPCEPSGPSDAACLEQFVRETGRLALRRPVTETEVTALVDLGSTFAADGGAFEEGVDVVVRALLQHPAFVYRVERGTPTAEAGVFRLNPYEVATRLSFLIWGSTPDDWLLDEVELGTLDTPDGVRTVAELMLEDPRARDRVDRFHAMWMGYWSLPHPQELTDAFRGETRALVEDVVFEQRSSWLELFTAEGSYLTDTLAAQYGDVPRPGGETPTWTDYGDSDRKGILAHGSFLSVNAKFGDTSPTLRGKLVRERLLCQTIPPPPPDVNVDEPTEGDGAIECKVDRYAVPSSNGACKSCHDLVDPIGFGLEAYDQAGTFREHDVGAPECGIDGVGDLDGQTFVGPAGLADLLVAGPDLPACMVLQSYRLAMGHDGGPDDAPYLERLIAGFETGDQRLDTLWLEIVGDEAFLHRRDEEVTP